MDPTGKLWVALDAKKDKSLEIVDKLGAAKLPVVRGAKLNRSIDQEVFAKAGERRILEVMKDLGIPAWVDLKFMDVPRTVVGRAEPYIMSGLVKYMTVMAKGEIDMMNEVVLIARPAGVNIIAVTELTSLTEEQVHLVSGNPAKASVINLARLAVLAEVEYLVCSGQELPAVRVRRELKRLKLFVPAVNPLFAIPGPDQNRTMNIAKALLLGADAVVVGSLIADAKDPIDVIKRISAEIEEAENQV